VLFRSLVFAEQDEKVREEWIDALRTVCVEKRILSLVPTFRSSLERFCDIIRDEGTWIRLNQQLILTYAEMTSYYQSTDSSDLALLTLSKELSRMQYAVITEDPKRPPLKDPEDIRQYHEASTKKFGSHPDAQIRDLLWKMANQSLFFSVVTQLQHLITTPFPHLSLGIRNKLTKFSLDFQRHVLHAWSIFEVVTLGCSGVAAVVIAELESEICVSPLNSHTWQCVTFPRLVITGGETLLAMATALAEHAVLQKPPQLGVESDLEVPRPEIDEALSIEENGVHWLVLPSQDSDPDGSRKSRDSQCSGEGSGQACAMM